MNRERIDGISISPHSTSRYFERFNGREGVAAANAAIRGILIGAVRVGTNDTDGFEEVWVGHRLGEKCVIIVRGECVTTLYGEADIYSPRIRRMVYG